MQISGVDGSYKIWKLGSGLLVSMFSKETEKIWQQGLAIESRHNESQKFKPFQDNIISSKICRGGQVS